MPASDQEFHDAFADYIGTDSEQWVYRNADTAAGDWVEWSVLFSETGIDYGSSAATIDAFQEFLVAFYPDTGRSPGEWNELRQEFFDEHGIDEHNIDWEAYREAIGYGRS